MVVSPSGFTSGCEAWASTYNLGLIPPLKGKKIYFRENNRIFERVIRALIKRVQIHYNDLLKPPGFYEFVYRMTADFEGYEEETEKGSRYIIANKGWVSSFEEMYSTLRGEKIIEVIGTTSIAGLKLEDGLLFYLKDGQVFWGKDDSNVDSMENVNLKCMRNLPPEDCTCDFIKECIVGRSITSAADFRTHFEFGIDNIYNVGFLQGSIYIISTQKYNEKN